MHEGSNDRAAVRAFPRLRYDRQDKLFLLRKPVIFEILHELEQRKVVNQINVVMQVLA